MLQTFFYIPDRLFGLPLFGWGLLLAVWAVAGAATLAYQIWRHGLGEETLSYLPLLALIGAAIWFLLPSLEQVEHLPNGENVVLGLPIRGYGVMLLIGLVSAVGLGVYRAKRRGIDPEIIYSLAIWLFIGGFGGARLFYVIEYWNQQFYHRLDGSFDLRATLAAVANVAQGGIVIFGGLAGGLLAATFFLWRHRLPALKIFDVCAPSVMLGLAIGRIGCFLNGCCYGGVCTLPWAVAFPLAFPHPSPPYERQMNRAELYLHGLAFSDQTTAKGLDGAALIYGVQPGSSAARAGLKGGEQILEIDRQRATDSTPERIFPALRREGPGEGSRAIDESLSAAEMALLSVSGEGTQIMIRTDRHAEPLRWSITAADEPPQSSLPVHPTQLYSSLDALLLCLVLLAYDPLRRHDGETLALLFMLHPIARFLLEAIRTDEPKAYFGMSISQVGSLLFLTAALALWFYVRRWPVHSVAAAPASNG
jgi:phosphatidylglycerol:prolipoprotein diacylglycerol transferase